MSDTGRTDVEVLECLPSAPTVLQATDQVFPERLGGFPEPDMGVLIDLNNLEVDEGGWRTDSRRVKGLSLITRVTLGGLWSVCVSN